jgi:hypothetical protein
MASRLAIAVLLASLIGLRPPAEDPIRARVLAFYRDDRAHRWPDVLDHFTVGKIAARWPPPVSEPAWIAAVPPPDDAACAPADGMPPSRMSITVVRRWARVFVTWCGARATDEVWLLRIDATWKIARLVRNVLPATFP